MSNNEFKFCKGCGKKIKSSARFCSGCGMECNFDHDSQADEEKNEEDEKSIKCLACGADLKPGTKFCFKCGTPVNIDTAKAQNINKKPLSKKQNYKPERAILGFIMILTISIIGIFIYVYKDTIFNLPDKNKDNVPKQGFSGTKAFDITPLEGVRITAAENALDKERKFVVSKLDDNEMTAMMDTFGKESIPVAGYKIDAGMKEDELLPGYVTVELDLKKLGIPEAMWDQIRIFRIDSKGDKTEIVSSNHNGVLQFNIKKNSKFVAVIAGLLIGLPVGYYIDILQKYGTEYKDDQYVQYDLNINFDNESRGRTAYFRLIWPDTLGSANPKEVERVDNAKRVIWERYGMTESNLITWKMQGPGYYMAKVLAVVDQIHKDKEYIELKKLTDSDDWKIKNLYPENVSPVVESLKYASAYLYKNRNFALPWYRVDILLKDKWPADDTALAYERDLAFTFPFVDINASKDYYDQSDINMTVLHELFHVVQKEYYGYCRDKLNYKWFMEACAMTLELEANKYYVENNWMKKPDIPMERNAWETFRIPLPDPGDKEIAAQNHGYTLSGFFESLRDNVNFNKNKKEDFLRNLMESFSKNMANPVSAIYSGCGSTKDELGNQFLEFANAKAADMRFFISAMVKDPGSCHTDISLLNGIGQSLDSDNPYYKWGFNEVKPLSVEFRVLSLDKIAVENLKNSYVYVVNGTKDSFKSNNIYHNINLNGNPQWTALEDEYKIIKGDNLKDLSIQRIDSNVFTPWFNPSEVNLRVILMLQPKEPKLTRMDNILRVEIEHSKLMETLTNEGVTVFYTLNVKIPGTDITYPYTLKAGYQVVDIDISENTDIGKSIKEAIASGTKKIEITYRENVKFSELKNTIAGSPSKTGEFELFNGFDWSGIWKRTSTEEVYPGVLNPFGGGTPVKVKMTKDDAITITPYNKDGHECMIVWDSITLVEGQNEQRDSKTYLGDISPDGREMFMERSDIVSNEYWIFKMKDKNTITDENNHDYTR